MPDEYSNLIENLSTFVNWMKNSMTEHRYIEPEQSNIFAIIQKIKQSWIPGLTSLITSLEGKTREQGHNIEDRGLPQNPETVTTNHPNSTARADRLKSLTEDFYQLKRTVITVEIEANEALRALNQEIDNWASQFRKLTKPKHSRKEQRTNQQQDKRLSPVSKTEKTEHLKNVQSIPGR